MATNGFDEWRLMEPKEDNDDATDDTSLLDLIGIKQSWTRSGASFFAFVAWAVGIAILLFGDGSLKQFTVAVFGCFVPAFLAVVVRQ